MSSHHQTETILSLQQSIILYSHVGPVDMKNSKAKVRGGIFPFLGKNFSNGIKIT